MYLQLQSEQKVLSHTMIIKSGALPKELAAVKALFDEHHQCLPPLKRDTNSYCLDRIGTHNVVATCLPYKECGFKTAAKVASDIDKTFPTLERIFLVGIGGGIPSKEHNIRLSDVVVGTGIIQHDIGKAMQKDSRLLRTGFTQRPNTSLRTAISKPYCQDTKDPKKIETDHLKAVFIMKKDKIHVKAAEGLKSSGNLGRQGHTFITVSSPAEVKL
ncbi:hypothetical protein M431DRAFT_531874 [Trichoderma harzianum CBS 226.95]|uniref:Nucleoside phosphorylase domain-containing protein n=1 Tax=Trichoderma harzianum CBS 226.95 TaxID=983964 RepID=A0A2T4ABH2_TRIHA|nr:hypothetical protein M431DRAFT_531874 [Trichoderma harzianum CBS 226.95]PTB54353.1 hypothetical protein M431DRAFT_531874 [Trichoderma harzianum CBS 226.95]